LLTSSVEGGRNSLTRSRYSKKPEGSKKNSNEAAEKVDKAKQGETQ
jgi:hypothetical protein